MAVQPHEHAQSNFLFIEFLLGTSAEFSGVRNSFFSDAGCFFNRFREKIPSFSFLICCVDIYLGRKFRVLERAHCSAQNGGVFR